MTSNILQRDRKKRKILFDHFPSTKIFASLATNKLVNIIHNKKIYKNAFHIVANHNKIENKIPNQKIPSLLPKKKKKS